MSREKKSRNQADNTTKLIVLITAIFKLIEVLIEFIKKLIE